MTDSMRRRELFDDGRLFAKGDVTASCQACEREAINGMCLAIVQSTGDAGQIRIKSTAAGLTGAEVAVEVAAP